jgi:hypothetical protein
MINSYHTGADLLVTVHITREGEPKRTVDLSISFDKYRVDNEILVKFAGEEQQLKELVMGAGEENQFKIPCIFIMSLKMDNDTIDITLYNGTMLAIKKSEGIKDQDFKNLKLYLSKSYYQAKSRYIMCQSSFKQETATVNSNDKENVNKIVKLFQNDLEKFKSTSDENTKLFSWTNLHRVF